MNNKLSYNILPIWRLNNILPLYRILLWFILLTYITGVLLDFDDSNDLSQEAKDWKTVSASLGIATSSILIFYSLMSICEHKNDAKTPMHEGTIAWVEWRPYSTNWWLPISIFSLLQFIIILIFSRFVDYDNSNLSTNSIFWTILNGALLLAMSVIGLKIEYLRMSAKNYWYHFFNVVVIVIFITFLSITTLDSEDLLQDMWPWATAMGFLLLFFIVIFIMEFPKSSNLDYTPIVIIFIWCGYAASFVDEDSWKLVLYFIYTLVIIATVIDSARISMKVLNSCCEKPQPDIKSIENVNV